MKTRTRCASLVSFAAAFCLASGQQVHTSSKNATETMGRCPKPFQGYGVCRTSRDCPTFCCARINEAPTRGWTGKCCVPRLLAPIIRAKGWCLDKEDDWDRLQSVAPGGELAPACPFPDDVLSCANECTSDTQCSRGQACCTNVCGTRSCVRSLAGNDLL